MLCDQIGIQCCTQITYVHSSGRAGGKSGSYFAHDVSPFHFWCVQHGHNDPLLLIIHPAAQIHKTIFIHKVFSICQQTPDNQKRRIVHINLYQHGAIIQVRFSRSPYASPLNMFNNKHQISVPPPPLCSPTVHERSSEMMTLSSVPAADVSHAAACTGSVLPHPPA